MTLANHRPALTMEEWQDFSHAGTLYSLAHLHAYTQIFQRPPLPEKPGQTYTVHISFSHHCFTKGLPSDEEERYDYSLRYDHQGDKRIFDTRRWQLSKQLPKLISEMHGRKCLQTGKGNFLSISVIDENGAEVQYEIYFRVWKPGRGRIKLHIESAYVRDPIATNESGIGSSRPKSARPIAFFTILHNTLNEIPIRS
jgi:hypothetical protein